MEPLWMLVALLLLFGAAGAAAWHGEASQRRKAKAARALRERQLRELEKEDQRKQLAERRGEEAVRRRAANLKRASEAYPGFWTEERIWERPGWVDAYWFDTLDALHALDVKELTDEELTNDDLSDAARLRELLGPADIVVKCERPEEDIRLWAASRVRGLENGDESLLREREALADGYRRDRRLEQERKRAHLEAEQQEADRQAKLKKRLEEQIVVKLDDLPSTDDDLRWKEKGP